MWVEIPREKEMERLKMKAIEVHPCNCAADILLLLLHQIALTYIDTFPVKLSRVKGTAPADCAHIYVCPSSLYTPTYK